MGSRNSSNLGPLDPLISLPPWRLIPGGSFEPGRSAARAAILNATISDKSVRVRLDMVVPPKIHNSLYLGCRILGESRTGKDSDHGVSFPDFPGCVTAGRTLEEARGMAVGALALHIQGMIEDGIAVPESSKLRSTDPSAPTLHGSATPPLSSLSAAKAL